MTNQIETLQKFIDEAEHIVFLVGLEFQLKVVYPIIGQTMEHTLS